MPHEVVHPASTGRRRGNGWTTFKKIRPCRDLRKEIRRPAGMTRRQAEDRIRHQSSRAQREAIADAVIDSEQPFEQMFDAVDMLVAQWRSECGNTSRRAEEQEA